MKHDFFYAVVMLAAFIFMCTLWLHFDNQEMNEELKSQIEQVNQNLSNQIACQVGDKAACEIFE